MTFFKSNNKIYINRLTNKVLRQNWSVGGGLLTDGVNDNISFASGYVFTSENFSFSLFFKYKTFSSSDGGTSPYLFRKNGQYYLQYSNDTKKLAFRTLQGTDYQRSAISFNAALDTLYHIVIVRNGDAVDFYINGIIQTKTATGVHINPTSTTSLLSLAGSTIFGNFYFFDFKCFTSVLTASEIYQLYITKGQTISASCISSLYSDYRFDDKSGTVLKDLSGNGRNGTLTNYAAGTTDLGSSNSWVDQYGNPITQY